MWHPTDGHDHSTRLGGDASTHTRVVSWNLVGTIMRGDKMVTPSSAMANREGLAAANLVDIVLCSGIFSRIGEKWYVP